MGFACFMSSAAGRILRAVLGLALIIFGLTRGTTGGYIVAAAGLVPLAAGAFDFCVFAAVLGVPARGRKIRERCAAQGR